MTRTPCDRGLIAAVVPHPGLNRGAIALMGFLLATGQGASNTEACAVIVAGFRRGMVAASVLAALAGVIGVLTAPRRETASGALTDPRH